MRILACRTAYGQGGLGQHFAQLVEESRTAGELLGYFAHTIKAGDESIGRTIDYVRLNRLKKYSPLRFFPTVVTRMGEDIFDRRVENALQRKSDRFMGFVGKSLFSFQRARSLGTEHLELVAANSHVRNVQRLHQLAAQTHGIRDTWLGEGLARKTEAEYETADAIYVHSNYTHRSLVQEGIPESKLVRTVLEVDQRFRPGTGRIDDAITRVVYTGRLDATKGVPLIREAMRRMPDEQIELTLVGGWACRVMRKYMQEWTHEDPRVRVEPGDPLPVLQRADIYVHPSYEDGFAYAPMEALACGVPVIVTRETGMKEYVKEGRNGHVIPAGSWRALHERMEHLIRHPLTIDDVLSVRAA